ncbi:MAG: hypothetical protein NC485_02235 [Ruminococcus flavefaciens]|nr:hypothetical protein [Ruminococcus flavefaciens]MCM1059985.1 hypothetical protein [Eubacterium sp.]
MSIYTCPHCGKKGFTPITKALAGKMNSKGKPCKYCGTKCVNGKAATIFNVVYSVIVIVSIFVIYFTSQHHDFLAMREIPLMILLILSEFIIPAVVNAFFFKMEESIRLDIS